MMSRTLGFGSWNQVLPFVLIIIVPLIVCVFEFNVLSCLLCSMVVLSVQWVLFVIAPFFSRFKKRDKNDAPSFVLETISVSHFSENIRWCLDCLGVEFVEQKCTGIFGMIVGGRSVPVLHYLGGFPHSPSSHTTLTDSRHILRFLYGLMPESMFLKPTPERLKFEAQFHVMGHAVQRWAYGYLLTDPQIDLTLYKKAWGLHDPDVPRWQRACLQALAPVFRRFIMYVMRLPSKRTHDSSWRKIRETFAMVEERLATTNNEYLFGDEPTFVDVTFSSLAAVMWMSELYGGGAADYCKVDDSLQPPKMRKDLRSLQEDYPKAFEFIDRMYHKHRDRSSTTELHASVM